jgi:ribosomal protein L12E/L44/L45/RPP1/RPP2
MSLILMPASSGEPSSAATTAPIEGCEVKPDIASTATSTTSTSASCRTEKAAENSSSEFQKRKERREEQRKEKNGEENKVEKQRIQAQGERTTDFALFVSHRHLAKERLERERKKRKECHLAERL